MTRRSRLQRRNRRVTFIRTSLAVIGIAVGIVSLIIMGTIASAIRDLPDLEKKANITVAETSKIFDVNRKLITTLHAEQNRVQIPLKRIPEHMRQAAIAIEDKRFYSHKGIDYEAIMRALFQNLKSGGVVEGGSTLTQQYVKNTLLKPERTMNRKIKEAFLAYQVEKKYSKKKILEKYINTVYFGHGNYGVETAAEYFFGKKAHQLKLEESALLAGLIRSPQRYSPYNHPEKAAKRRDQVLSNMVKQKFITRAEAEEAMQKRIKLKVQRESKKYKAAYFVEYVKSLIMKNEKFGANEQQRANSLFKGGLKIYTSIDLNLQRMAEEAASKNLNAPGDPTASLVSIEPKTGYIKAMVGGKDFFGPGEQAKFNVAVQGRRQTGSSFKVFVLVGALMQGMSPNKTYQSSPVTIPMPGGAPPWRVSNYTEGSGYGPMSIAEGTVKSVNALYARLMMDVGPKNVVQTANKMGITSKIEPNPAIALGGLSRGVSPLDMAATMATLADSGIKHRPIAITRVVSSGGKVFISSKPSGKRVLPSGVAATTTSVLQGVIQRGTGTAANIGRPAAGKTGTAQNYRDAWFIGYTPNLATAVWVGHPHAQVAMLSVHGRRVSGGSFPAQVWHDFMAPAHEGIPVTPFPYSPYAPKEKTVKICEASGKLATENCPADLVHDKFFEEGKAPSEYCDVHGRNEVPNVIGMSTARAASMLNSAGFVVSKAYEDSNKPAGTVISQSPSGGKSASPGSKVTIHISKGSQTIPNVVGMTQAAAVSALRNAGFSVSIKTAAGEEGIVLAQSPKAGSKAPRDSTVTITVGSGVPPPDDG